MKIFNNLFNYFIDSDNASLRCIVAMLSLILMLSIGLVFIEKNYSNALEHEVEAQENVIKAQENVIKMQKSALKVYEDGFKKLQK